MSSQTSGLAQVPEAYRRRRGQEIDLRAACPAFSVSEPCRLGGEPRQQALIDHPEVRPVNARLAWRSQIAMRFRDGRPCVDRDERRDDEDRREDEGGFAWLRCHIFPLWGLFEQVLLHEGRLENCDLRHTSLE